MSDAAEVIRKKYLYRRLILSRRLPVSAKGAALLIGPDCAYHLYHTHTADPDPGPHEKRRPRTR